LRKFCVEKILEKMTLLPVDQKISYTLLDIYCNKKAPVSADEIAGALDKHPGTIRNRISVLRNLGLVDSTPGPKGGYIPTAKAYTDLGFSEESAISANISKIIDGKEIRIENINVQSIEIVGIAYLKRCGARVKVIGNTKEIKNEDVIKIGPIQPSGLVVVGKVMGRDDVRHQLIIEISNMRLDI